jgi:hypothetical protein
MKALRAAVRKGINTLPISTRERIARQFLEPPKSAGQTRPEPYR